MLNALILAGEDSNNKLGTQVKALIDIHGKPMVQYVIEVLKKCELVDKIGVIGPYEKLYDLLNGQVDYIIDGKGLIIDNVAEGVKFLGKEKHLIICTSDIPMLTVECVNDFIGKSRETGADLCYPIVDKTVNDIRFPGIERTYTTIKEGTFTGGNLFYINPNVIDKCCIKAQQLIVYRKNVLKMASVLGLGTLILLLTKQLTISQAEKRFSKIFDIKARAIISDYPELANDVDKPSDLAFVKAQLKIN
ncbi:MAG: hypothetical protein PWR27_2165 [Petroclostridium sp.]|uniref:nucleotidyltransferase family protein n=1 Tax=Petroclostridium xylanilyticum TaxID=1792311 RepID=UPI0018E3AE8D|nr:nucleotidyltransferase family protein [Petroclostridium xylanilyticum]MBZ4645402.1 molybdopterin-guanine dinucleotide biosynthesis protein A-like protein [Clostridia bacterium]MDK2811456.1 hypothetical protein [Petroclostridium sp.]